MCKQNGGKVMKALENKFSYLSLLKEVIDLGTFHLLRIG